MKPLYQELPFSVEHYINFYREDLPYFIVPWHYHPEIEIMCIEQGSGTRFVGDHIENYEVGDVCIIGPQLPHEWRNDKEFFGEGTGLRSVCLCVYFRKELFEGVMINLPEFMNIRNLIERSRRGIKFTGTARDRIADFIRSTFNSNGAVRVTNLITLLEMMANTEEYELLASVGFTQSVNSSGSASAENWRSAPFPAESPHGEPDLSPCRPPRPQTECSPPDGAPSINLPQPAPD